MSKITGGVFQSLDMFVMTAEYLEGRAARAIRPAFDGVLAKVADVPAREDDRID